MVRDCSQRPQVDTQITPTTWPAMTQRFTKVAAALKTRSIVGWCAEGQPLRHLRKIEAVGRSAPSPTSPENKWKPLAALSLDRRKKVISGAKGTRSFWKRRLQKRNCKVSRLASLKFSKELIRRIKKPWSVRLARSSMTVRQISTWHLIAHFQERDRSLMCKI